MNAQERPSPEEPPSTETSPAETAPTPATEAAAATETGADTDDDEKPEPKDDASEETPSRGDYTVSLGGSLDLLDGIASDVYVDFDFLIPHLGAVQDEAWWRENAARPVLGLPEGLRVGFFRGTTPEQADTSNTGDAYYLRGAPSLDSIRVVRRNLVRQLSRERDLFGVRFSSLRMVTPNVGWALHGELRRRTDTVVFSDTLLSSDTLQVNIRELDPALGFSPRPTSLRTQRTTYDGYLGLGGLFYLDEGGVNLAVQPILAVNPAGTVGPSGSSSPFHYILYFRAREEELGITFGGSIQGSLAGEEPDFILYVSKAFSLKDFRDRIKFK